MTQDQVQAGRSGWESAERIQRLLHATADGDVATVRDLIQGDPTLVNARGRHPFWGGEPQPLQVAAEWGCLDVVRLLLDAGADLGAVGSSYGGWTPLHCALNHGHGSADFDAIAKLLIERGATVDIWAAARMGDLARVQALLDDDLSRLHARGPSDKTPLHFAGTVAMAQLLIARGAVPQACDCYGHTPLQCAAGARYGAVARYLMDVTGESNIALACAAGDVARVRMFLDADPATVHSRLDRAVMPVGFGFPDGDSLLHVAACSGQLGVARLLIERGADVNAVSTKGQRPLHFAAGSGHIGMAALLLDHGAEIAAIETEHGGTPLDWAAFHHQEEMVRFLQSRAAEIASHDSNSQTENAT